MEQNCYVYWLKHKSTGKKYIGSKWYNDGKRSYKYTAKMQQEQNFELFLKENKSFIIGRCKTETKIDRIWDNNGNKNMMINPDNFDCNKHIKERIKNDNKN